MDLRLPRESRRVLARAKERLRGWRGGAEKCTDGEPQTKKIKKLPSSGVGFRAYRV